MNFSLHYIGLVVCRLCLTVYTAFISSTLDKVLKFYKYSHL